MRTWNVQLDIKEEPIAEDESDADTSMVIVHHDLENVKSEAGEEESIELNDVKSDSLDCPFNCKKFTHVGELHRHLHTHHLDLGDDGLGRRRAGEAVRRARPRRPEAV